MKCHPLKIKQEMFLPNRTSLAISKFLLAKTTLCQPFQPHFHRNNFAIPRQSGSSGSVEPALKQRLTVCDRIEASASGICEV